MAIPTALPLLPLLMPLLELGPLRRPPAAVAPSQPSEQLRVAPLPQLLRPPPPRETPREPPEPVPVVPPVSVPVPVPRDAWLLSAGRPARASVRGNLSPAGVVTSAATDDWLRDRWQAASDMRGTPIRGGEIRATTHAKLVLSRRTPRLLLVGNASTRAPRRRTLGHGVAREALRRVARHENLGRPHARASENKDSFATQAAEGLASRIVLDWESAYANDYVLETRARADAEWRVLRTERVSRDKTKQHVVDVLRVLDTRAAPEFRVRIRRGATRWGVSLWRFEVWGSLVAGPSQLE